MDFPAQPAKPDIPLRSSPEADFDAKMVLLFQWAVNDFFSFVDAFVTWLTENSTVIGGELNDTDIGQTTPAAGAFTALSAAAVAYFADKLGVGTASPSHLIDVQGIGGEVAIRVKNTDAAGADPDANFYLDAGNASGEAALEFMKGGLPEARVIALLDKLRLVHDVGAIELHAAGQAALSVSSTAIEPGTDNTHTGGSASKRLKEIFAVDGAINTSDMGEKANIRPLNEAEKRVAQELVNDFRIFQWISAVADKGEAGARLHVGQMAQWVERKFAAEGLDAGRYGMFTRDKIFRTVTDTKMVQVQKVEKSTQQRTIIEVIDGRATEKTVSEEISVPVYEVLPVFDEAGQPVMVPGPGGPVQKTARVPVLVEEKREFTEEVEDGERLGLRYPELMCFIMAGTLGA
ncbi:tail fiber domain-containing protein [Leisingera sp. ANG-S3]|uniref:tail fiber domain-containing protein n=1 Tax=Leisingera sp. ANG-S3 TaxID=1577899 RepID=UPI000580A96A|nr:hypothetical protein [Leisingera sp. ANG-S3]KIC25391.1 hypothetical protein RA23_05860 [Leisingera sp. ANG-S3]